MIFIYTSFIRQALNQKKEKCKNQKNNIEKKVNITGILTK